MRGICTTKIGATSQLGAEKITFPPKPDGQTYLQTDRQTDGHMLLRVALLLKMNPNIQKLFFFKGNRPIRCNKQKIHQYI